jgi:hypothetical protein
VEVRIGITQSPKEIDIELPDGATPESVKENVSEALSSGGVLWLTDRKGRQYGVSAERLAYVEIGSIDAGGRRIGFGG